MDAVIGYWQKGRLLRQPLRRYFNGPFGSPIDRSAFHRTMSHP
jgi:hypothetical protein